MNKETLRVKVAELCGCVCRRCGGTGMYMQYGEHEWFRRSLYGKLGDQAPIACDHVTFDSTHPYVVLFPDYPNDLNAIAEAEKTLTDEQHEEFRKHLRAIVARDANVNPMSDVARRAYISAKANQRCEAFVLTMEGVKP